MIMTKTKNRGSQSATTEIKVYYLLHLVLHHHLHYVCYLLY